MSYLSDISFTWWQFFRTAGWLALGYFVLMALGRWLAYGKVGRLQIGNRWRRRLQSTANMALTLFEPAAVLLLAGIFIFIQPGLHGLIALVLLTAGFPNLRNYINGRILLLHSEINSANRLESGGLQGSILRRGRLGLYLRLEQGLRYIPYTTLSDQGFTLIAGEDLGRLFRMRLLPSGEANPNRLQGLLVATPYLDRSQGPELNPLPEGGFEANLLLLDESYLPDLIQLMGEWGWTCEPFNADTWKS